MNLVAAAMVAIKPDDSERRVIFEAVETRHSEKKVERSAISETVTQLSSNAPLMVAAKTIGLIHICLASQLVPLLSD